MSFGDDLMRWNAKIQAQSKAVFAGTVARAHGSIVDGSSVTGSPGQPVGQYGPGYHEGDVGGELKSSWQTEFLAPWVAQVVTNNPYARSNEDGIARPGGGPYTQRSTVGGRHSVKITALGIQKLVDAEVRKVRP
jgi:hypothetical protein